MMQAAAATVRACERQSYVGGVAVMQCCPASGCMTVHGIEVCGVALMLWYFSIFICINEACACRHGGPGLL
jgi:hypothetical protein